MNEPDYPYYVISRFGVWLGVFLTFATGLIFGFGLGLWAALS